MATSASYDHVVDREEFEERYALAADATGALAGPDELDEAWDEYRAGAWSGVLADPTPEHAVQANRLAGSIAELLADPQPGDARWCGRLAARVDQLAALLVPGDAAGEDPHPWEEWVSRPRREYPDVVTRP